MPESLIGDAIRAGHYMKEGQEALRALMKDPQSKKATKYFNALEIEILKKDKYRIESIGCFLEKALATSKEKALFRDIFLLPRPEADQILKAFGIEI